MSSKSIIIFAALAMLLVLGILIWAQRHKNRLEYEQQASLFTPAETRFLQVLDQAVGRGFRVFGKVRIADVLAPSQRMSGQNRRLAFNKTSCKHFDFVLCDPDTMSVLCVIELNDRSHLRSDRRERDAFVARACRSAGLPLVMIENQRQYDINTVVKQITDAVMATKSRDKPVRAV